MSAQEPHFFSHFCNIHHLVIFERIMSFNVVCWPPTVISYLFINNPFSKQQISTDLQCKWLFSSLYEWTLMCWISCWLSCHWWFQQRGSSTGSSPTTTQSTERSTTETSIWSQKPFKWTPTPSLKNINTELKCIPLHCLSFHCFHCS